MSKNATITIVLSNRTDAVKECLNVTGEYTPRRKSLTFSLTDEQDDILQIAKHCGFKSVDLVFIESELPDEKGKENEDSNS